MRKAANEAAKYYGRSAAVSSQGCQDGLEKRAVEGDRMLLSPRNLRHATAMLSGRSNTQGSTLGAGTLRCWVRSGAREDVATGRRGLTSPRVRGWSWMPHKTSRQPIRDSQTDTPLSFETGNLGFDPSGVRPFHSACCSASSEPIHSCEAISVSMRAQETQINRPRGKATQILIKVRTVII